MLKLKDKNKKLVAGLINYKDLCIESILATGDKKLSFSLHKEDKFYNLIEEECYIETKTQEYVIKARDVGVDYTKFDCVLNLEELEANIFDRFESVEQTITASLNLAIVGTGWTVKDNTLKKKRTVRCTNKNSLEIVQEIKKTYRVDIVFNTLKREIEVYEHLGEDKGAYFIDSLNLTALQVQSDSYKFATRIVAEGKDGLTFENINNGKNYVENYQYSNKIKTIYWKDERYTVKESLLEDAKAKLEELSKPFTSYNASVLNLAELNPKYKSILDYSLGDTITLLSKSNKVRDKQRIVKTLEYPQDHTKDTVELANATLKFEDIQQENQETTDTVNNITSDNGTLDSNAIEDNSIEIKKIDNFEANVLKVTKLDVINANIENLHANKADIQDLNVVKARIGTLEATKANITQLNAVSAEISKLSALKADITDLNAANGKINVLESKTASIDNLLSQKASINDLKALNATISDALIKKATIAQLEALETKTNNLIADKANIKDLNVINANINSLKAYTADIKTLLNGNLSSENIQTKGITSDKLVIANGFIKDAMIDSINVNKLNAGVLATDKFNIRSRDGNLIIKDNTIQIKDSSKVRVQVGKDASGDYSLYVWDKLGNLMFNALGITKDAIKDKIIRNDMVSDDAAIEGKKLNIESVIREVNNGKSNLKASKIDIDTKGQTLDIAFSNLVTENGKNKEEIVSLITKLNVQQGQINASIENSKVLEGKQKTLEDNYNRTVVTVDSLKNTMGSHKTLIDSATGKITSVEIKANTLEKNLSGLTQTVNDTKKVIENNKTVLESKNAELKANIDNVSSSLSSVSSTVDKNNKTLVAKTNTLEQNLNGLTQRVESNKTVTDGKITSVEGETHELKTSLGGLTSKLDTLKSTTDGINKTVSNQGSIINQLKDSIKLKVDSSTFTQSTQTINSNINKAKEDAITTANNNISNAIDNLKIGGRNLAQLTEPKEYSSFTGRVNDCQMGYEILLDTLNADDPVTVSYTFSYENLVPVNNHNNYGIWLQGCGDVTEWNSGGFPGGSRLTPKINWGTGHSGSFKVEYTFKLEANAKKNKKWFTSFRMDYIQSGKVSVKEFMVEYGTKANAYIQAPEDLQVYADKVAKAKADLAKTEAIANADGKITEEERKRIQQAQENLNTAIARADKAKADAKAYSDTLGQQLKANAEKYANDVAIAKAELAKQQSKAYSDGIVTEEEKKRIKQAEDNLNIAIAKANEAENKAREYADAKKIEAINKASADAALKAAEALNNAKAFTTAEINTTNSNLHKATAEINILKEKIESKVGTADIEKAIQNIKLGGRNLVKKHNITLFNSTGTYEASTNTWTLTATNGAGGVWGAGLCIRNSRDILIPYGEGFMLSFEVKVSVNCTWNVDTNCYPISGNSWSGNDNDNVTKRKTSSKDLTANKWIKCWAYYENTNSQNTNFLDLYDESNIGIINNTGNNLTFQIRNIKGELGNKPSDWTPAPEDIDQLIIDSQNVVTEKIKVVESNLTQTKNSIDASVRDLNSTTQTITTNVGNINRELTNKINSNLDMAKNFATDMATSKANAAKQEAINTANNNTTNVINNLEIGGRNLFLDTKNYANEGLWNCREGGSKQSEKYKGLTVMKFENDWGSFDQIIQADEGEEFVFSAYVKSGNNTTKLGFYCGSVLITNRINFSQGEVLGTNWKRVSAVFKTNKGAIQPRFEGYSFNGGTCSFYICGCKLERGNKPTAYSEAEEDLKRYSDDVAKAKSELAKQDAINAASADATNKTNNALNSAKAYVNAEITTVNTKVNNVESNINILKNKIESKVGQSDIDKSISAIKIGGRNLVQQSIPKEYTGFSGKDNDCQFNYEVLLDTLNVGDTITVSFLFSYENLILASNTGYGFRIQGSGDVVGWSDGAFPSFPFTNKIQFGSGKSGSFRVEYNYVLTSNSKKNTKWYPNIRTDKIQSGKMAIKEFMVEFGTKRTAYVPAPEDTDKLVVDSIKVVDTKISDVSSSVTQLRDSVTTDIRAINSKTQSIETTLGSKASKQEVTEVNNRVATIKASLDSITQRVSSTESKTQTLETNLNGKASKQEVNNVSSKVASIETSLNGITQRVSSAESNINKTNDRINSLASKEEVAQLKITTNSISTEVSKKVNSNELISKINQSAETVQINASKINLQGYVTVGELGSSNVTTINNAHITSGTIEGRTMIALNGTGKQNGVLTVNNGESYLEYFRCREAWMMSPYANGWRVPLIHSKFGVKDSETASDMIDEISFYRGTDGRNYLQITNTKTGRVEYIELYRSAFDTVTILNRLDRIDAKLARL
ncbi:phage tail spike protein [Clostridium perfringens]|uniref:phage tail spike protein n=2 Tax=Clostridium perfringens TaxID=1502 RepID=UPI002B1EB121|nr:phage tail spike protein [Clostridium perfringens]MEA5310193.1 phage tail spike protein [Clostridium perfringens]